MSVPTVYFLLRLYFAVINIAALVLFGVDKFIAKKNEKTKKRSKRIPEAYLLCAAFFGGGFGAFLGMKVFGHKTKKKYFKWLVLAFVAIQLAALLILTMGL